MVSVAKTECVDLLLDLFQCKFMVITHSKVFLYGIVIFSRNIYRLISETLHERNLRASSGAEHFDSEYLKHLNAELDKILTKAKSELKDTKDRYYEIDERKLVRRIEQYKENYFLWARNFAIPPTNNLSERSLRMQKTKLRVSGQYCSIKSAEYFADIRIYTETCSRNGISPFDALSRLMAGNPYSLDEVLSSGDCE